MGFWAAEIYFSESSGAEGSAQASEDDRVTTRFDPS